MHNTNNFILNNSIVSVMLQIRILAVMKIKGLKQVLRQVQNLERDSQKAINKGIQQTAKLILNSALAKAPIKDSYLRGTIGMEMFPETMSAKVYAAALYAAYVEFGTGDFVDVPLGLEDYAMLYFVNGKGKTKPQPFLFNSFAEHKEKLVPLIEAELIKLLKNG